MCTVTFIPAKDKFFITSNRDEKAQRKQAIRPKSYTDRDKTMIFPKDADAGGSWIAMETNGNAAVLLNGAFFKHISMPPYKRSRGNVFLEVIAGDMPVQKFLHIDLFNIEPFTLIVFEDNNLYECRWDGSRKYCKQLENYRPYIWSSATLYNEDVIKKREYWYLKWLNKNPDPNQQDILHFHQFAGDGDAYNDLRMNRNGTLFTVSVTGIEINDEKGIMRYLDLKDNMVYRQEMEFICDTKNQRRA
jgi:hypothetical protein